MVRLGVAENPRTPAEVLVRLSRDESIWVRGYVARNSKWKEPANQERIKELKELIELEEIFGVKLF
jgi:hypothetical protein